MNFVSTLDCSQSLLLAHSLSLPRHCQHGATLGLHDLFFRTSEVDNSALCESPAACDRQKGCVVIQAACDSMWHVISCDVCMEIDKLAYGSFHGHSSSICIGIGE